MVLNLLAFAYHTVASLAVLAWREAVAAKGATYRVFEHLRTITAYVVSQDCPHLLAAALEEPRLHSILELQNPGKQLWQGVDAAAYVETERSSWD